MQLSAVFLLGCCLQVAATGLSQTVTFSGKDVSLEKVFLEVEKQTGLLIVYKAEQVRQAKPVTISAKALPIGDFLQKVLNGRLLDYSIKENTIFIRKRDSEEKKNSENEKVSPPITGVVRGPDGQPIAGVNVVVKGTKNGVVTDAYGRFSIEAEQGKVLVISNIGYNAREIKVNGNEDIIVGIGDKYFEIGRGADYCLWYEFTKIPNRKRGRRESK